MGATGDRIRSFGAGSRSKFDARRILRGDSIWIRVLVFTLMSAVFILTVLVTKRTGINQQTREGLNEDSTEVSAPATPQKPAPTPHTGK